jgi:hypothetical protein
MASRTINFPFVLRKNINENSRAYGKYYAKPTGSQTLSLEGLITRAAFDQSVYSNDIVKGVIEKLTTVMKEVLSSGVPVKWDNLGTFTPTIENKPNGVTKQSVIDGDWDQGTLIVGVHITFRPENMDGKAMTSRAFRDDCVFELSGIEEGIDLTPDVQDKTKKKWGKKITSLEAWKKEQEEPEP